MKITRTEMERRCEQVCLFLNEIHSCPKGEASREQWNDMWAALKYWQVACRQQGRKSGRNLTNKLAWNVCASLDRYDCRDAEFGKHECWISIWTDFGRWKNNDYSHEDRKRRFAIINAEQKKMDKEFRDIVS